MKIAIDNVAMQILNEMRTSDEWATPPVRLDNNDWEIEIDDELWDRLIKVHWDPSWAIRILYRRQGKRA